MEKKLLVFAQEAEALPTIAMLNAYPIEGEYLEIYSEGYRPCCYAFEGGWIILTNMGPLAASLAVAKYLCRFNVTEVINLGLSASLEAEATIGKIHKVAYVGVHALFPQKIDEKSQAFYHALHPTLPLLKEGARLLSSPYPIHDATLKKDLMKEWNLIDMEGYGIAHTALHFGKKVTLYKIISDFAQQGGRELIQKHKKSLAEALATLAYSLT